MPTYLTFQATIARAPNGFPLVTSPATQLALIDPASGLVVVVPYVAGQPTNGLVMFSEQLNERTTRTLIAARGTAYPSGEPVKVVWGVRDLLTR